MGETLTRVYNWSPSKTWVAAFRVARRFHRAVQFGDDLERALAFGVVEDVRGHHQLVGAGAADEIVETTPDRVRPADDGAAERIIENGAGVRIELRLEILDRWRHSATASGPVVQRRLLQ